MWKTYILIGIIALIVGIVLGQFIRPFRAAVGQPSLAVLQPVSDDISSRRFVVIGPTRRRVVLFEARGDTLLQLDRKSY